MSIKITVQVGDILYHSIGGIVLISTIGGSHPGTAKKRHNQKITFAKML